MNEDKTSIEKLANMNLEGLLLPEPATVSYGWAWLIAGLLVATILLAWRRKYKSPKTTALRELRRLQTDLKNNDYDEKNIKKQIAQSLRQGFSATRLDYVMPDNIMWREYLTDLETALYTNNPNDTQTLLSLIKSAQRWLKTST